MTKMKKEAKNKQSTTVSKTNRSILEVRTSPEPLQHQESKPVETVEENTLLTFELNPALPCVSPVLSPNSGIDYILEQAPFTDEFKESLLHHDYFTQEHVYRTVSNLELCERINDILNRDKMIQKQLAEDLRLSPSLISNFLHGTVKNLKEPYQEKLRSWCVRRDSLFMVHVTNQMRIFGIKEDILCRLAHITSTEFQEWFCFFPPLEKRTRIEKALLAFLELSKTKMDKLISNYYMNAYEKTQATTLSENLMYVVRSSGKPTSYTSRRSLNASEPGTESITLVSSEDVAYITPSKTERNVSAEPPNFPISAYNLRRSHSPRNPVSSLYANYPYPSILATPIATPLSSLSDTTTTGSSSRRSNSSRISSISNVSNSTNTADQDLLNTLITPSTQRIEALAPRWAQLIESLTVPRHGETEYDQITTIQDLQRTFGSENALYATLLDRPELAFVTPQRLLPRDSLASTVTSTPSSSQGSSLSTITVESSEQSPKRSSRKRKQRQSPLTSDIIQTPPSLPLGLRSSKRTRR